MKSTRRFITVILTVCIFSDCKNPARLVPLFYFSFIAMMATSNNKRAAIQEFFLTFSFIAVVRTSLSNRKHVQTGLECDNGNNPKTITIQNVVTSMLCNLKEARRRAPVVLSHVPFLDKFVLRLSRNSYLPASGQNSDIAIKFSDPDFLIEQ